MIIRVFVAVVAEIQVRAPISTICADLESYLEKEQIDYEKAEHPEQGLRYALVGGENTVSEGYILVKLLAERQVSFLVQRVFTGLSEQEDYDRFIRLRNKLQSFLLQNFLPAANPDRVLKYDNAFDRDVLSPQNRERIAAKKAEQRENWRKQGFEKRILLDGTFETSPEAAWSLLLQYIYRQREFGNPFWNLIDPDYRTQNKTSWAKDLFISGRQHFSELGKIKLIQVNEKICKFTIENAWEAIRFADPAEADEMYFETLKELSNLASYIKNLFMPQKDYSEDSTDDLQRNRTDPSSGISIKTSISDDIPLWMNIPDKNFDRQILKLWHEGLPSSVIAERLCMIPKSITNRISELRGIYGKEIVPLRK